MATIFCCTRAGFAADYLVGDTDGALAPADFAWQTLRAGDRVVLRPGNYSDTILISARGTQKDPVVVGAAPGTVLRCSVVLSGAQHVVLDGLTIEDARGGGVVLTGQSSGNRILRSTVRRCGLGILFKDGTGSANTVEDCLIEANLTNGIAVDRFNASPSGANALVGNIVSRNGYHGIDLNGSHYRVERNRVAGNGSRIAGTSGIHVYARDRAEGTGRHNLIRANIVSGQRETTGQDGNGIQVDTWCDDNEVTFNAAFGNCGAGIHLYDASANRVSNNTVVGNMVDCDSGHVLRGELVVASDEVRRLDHAHRNLLVNNIAVATRPRTAAMAIHRTITDAPGVFAGNILWRTGPGPLWTWAGREGVEIAPWNRLRPGSPAWDALDRSVDPDLGQLVPTAELPASRAFRPRRGPAFGGFAGLPSAGQTDLAGGRTVPGLTGALMPAG